MPLTNNLVLMGDCGPCERPECAPTFIDVVTTAGERYRLGKTGYTTVWTTDVPGAILGVAYGPSFEGQVVFVTYVDSFYHKIHTAEMDTGEDVGELADLLGVGAAYPSQESSVAVPFIPWSEVDPLPCASDNISTTAGYTMSPEGVAVGPYAATLITDNYGGSVLIGDVFYLFNSEEVHIQRSALPDGFSTAWLDLSPYLVGSPGVSPIRYDDLRGMIYVVGFDGDGLFTVYRIDPSDADVTALATSTEITNTGSRIQAFSIHSDGLWWIHGTKVWRYSFAGGTVDMMLEKTSGSWPSFGVEGCAFIVGEADTCNRDCECVPEMTLTYDPTPAEEEGAPVAGCGTSPPEGWVDVPSCNLYYDYEITLCPGRTLTRLIFQKTRGAVFINGTLSTHITDWTSLPLTGRIKILVGGDEPCGQKTGSFRFVLIDSAGCCSRGGASYDCCRCCPPSGGGITFEDASGPLPPEMEGYEGDTTPRHNWGAWGPMVDCIDGVVEPSETGPVAGQDWSYYELVPPSEADVTACGDNSGGWFMDWSGAVKVPGDPDLPDCIYVGGDPIKFRINHGGLGSNVCIRATPFDAAVCVGEPLYYHFGYTYTSEDPEVPCGDPANCPPVEE